MVKNTNTEMVRVSGVNSQSSIDIFSKYLASLALRYDKDIIIDNFGDVESYVGDVIYSKEYNIYYLFEENQFLLRDVSDKTVLKKSSLIATPEEMEKYFNKVTCSLSGSDLSTKYIQKCKERAGDFLTNSIRLPLEKFMEYLFEDDDPYPENFEITYNSFFNISEYFLGDIKPEILSEERLAKLFNLTLLGDHFISNKLNEYLNSLYIGELHRDYDFLFYANFLTIKEIVDNARDKIIVGQFIGQILSDVNQYKDEWFFKETDFIEQSVSIARKFPEFLEEICGNTTEKSLGHILYIEYYYKYHYFGNYGKFKHLLSCKTYGVDWCKNIISLLSNLNNKIQETKDENEIVYNSWKRIESFFLDDVTEFNHFLLGDDSNKDKNQIHPSLIDFIQFIRNHNNLDELRFIYQTTDTEKVIDIGILPEEAFEVKFEKVYIKSQFVYPKDLPIVITGFENVDITELKNRLGFYCDAIYCNNNSRKLIVPKDELQVWKDFEGLYKRGMIKSIMWNEDLTGFIDSILEQNK